MNGNVGVWLFPSTTPGGGPAGVGSVQRAHCRGHVHRCNFIGPFTGMSVADVWELIENGGAYVNVHERQRRAHRNRSGRSSPAGEIRGDF